MCRLGPSVQKDVGRVDDLHRAVLEQPSKRSVGIKSAEPTADLVLLGRVTTKLRADEMRAMLPGAQDRRAVAGAPEIEHARERAGEQRREGLGLNFAAQRRGLSVGEIGGRV